MKKFLSISIILFQGIKLFAFQSSSQVELNDQLPFPKDLSNHNELINIVSDNGKISVKATLFYDTEVSINEQLNAKMVYSIYLSLFENLAHYKCFPNRSKRMYKREEVFVIANKKCLNLLLNSPFIKEIQERQTQISRRSVLFRN